MIAKAARLRGTIEVMRDSPVQHLFYWLAAELQGLGAKTARGTDGGLFDGGRARADRSQVTVAWREQKKATLGGKAPSI